MTTTTLQYNFGSDAAGLKFTIDVKYDSTGLGLTTFTVNVLTGSLNLNALYWKDADQSFDGTISNLLTTTTFFQETWNKTSSGTYATPATGTESAWDPNAKG